MADMALKERLQPSLLDRLDDTVGGIDRNLQRERGRLLEILNEGERDAFAKLVNLESRGLRPLKDDELGPFSRLEPKEVELLQRVVELEQSKFHELRQHHVISMDRLKKCVERDLEWLFNTEQLDGALDLSEFPNVRSSVVNFGMPSLTGSTSSTVDVEQLERALADVIRDFEPRISRDSVRVRVYVDDEQMSSNTVIFEIEGELWGEPLPLRLYLQTVFDLETGGAKVAERAA